MSRDPTLVRRILANDLRLFFRSWEKKKGAFGGGVVLQLGVLALIHLPVSTLIRQVASPSGMPGGAEFACFVAALFVAMAALNRSLEVLYNRGDLPLLLSSPAPLRIIIGTRLADIVLTTLLGSALLVVPVLDVAAFVLGPRWLWGWAAWFLGAATLAACALGFTVWLVRRIGARRARVCTQVAALIVGACAFVGFQAPNWFARRHSGRALVEAQRQFFDWFDLPVFNQVARAAHGDWLWLSVLAILAAVSLAWAVRHLAREFASGAQSAAGEGGPPVRRDAASHARAWNSAFTRPRWASLVLKELRLVLRDPLLLARASLQIVTLVPAVIWAFLFSPAVGIASVGLVGSAMSGVILAALMTANDEAHECAAASPLRRRAATLARTTAAALLPAGIGICLSLAVLALGSPVLAAFTAIGAAANAAALAWFVACTTSPHTAEERAQNKQPNVMGPTLASMALGGMGAAAVALWAQGLHLGALILFAAALACASLSALAQPRPGWST